MLVAGAIEKCIGCRLCSFYAGLLSQNLAGLNCSCVRIDYHADVDSFTLAIDPGSSLGKKDFEKIVKLCPRQCLEIAS